VVENRSAARQSNIVNSESSVNLKAHIVATKPRPQKKKHSHASRSEKKIVSKHTEEPVAMPNLEGGTAVDCDVEREELIRQTAYSNYVARNYADGHELLDWLQAESHVNQMRG
jgi:hypothetical protein